MSDVLEALEALVYNGLPRLAVVPIINDLFENNGWDDEDDKRLCVLVTHLAEQGEGLHFDAGINYSGGTFEAGGGEYLVLTEDERDTRWEDCLDSCLDDGCIEGTNSPYFDREAWKRDARMDGAGHSLASYDGDEWEFTAGHEEFYIYRTN